MHSPARAALRSAGALAIAGLAFLVSPGRGAAQEAVAVAVDGGSWDVWVDGQRCPSPCALETADASLDYDLSEPGADEPGDDMHLELVDTDAGGAGSSDEHGPVVSTIEHGRWSHAGERTAGAVTIAAGWIGGLALGLGLSAWIVDVESRCSGFCLGPSLGIGFIAAPSGLLLGVLGTIIGGALMDLDDYPTTTARGARRARALASDDPGGRAAGYVVATIIGLGMVAPLLALGIGLGTGNYGAALGTGIALGIVGSPFLVTLTGHVAGGRGDLGAAALGAAIPVVGAASIYAIAAAGLGATPGNESAQLSVALAAGGSGVVLSLVGAIIGYEIGHGRARAHDLAADAGHDVALQPTFGVSPEGASIGLDGSF